MALSSKSNYNLDMKTFPVPAIQTKAIFTVAQQKVDCPKCRQVADFYCTYPSGGKATQPHSERLDAYKASIPIRLFSSRHSIQSLGIKDVLARLNR